MGELIPSPENFESKCCISFVLDVSYSMQGSFIDELNKGLQEFHKEILEDSTASNRLEIGLVEFSSSVDVLIEPSLAHNFTMPLLSVKGTTALVDGVREGIAMVKKRKQYYKDSGQTYYRPWVILITDGSPDSGQDTEGLKREINNGVDTKDFFFFALGVDGADMTVLKHISSPQMPPVPLNGVKFLEFFQWLSRSLGSSGVTGSVPGANVVFESPDSWLKGIPVS